MKKLLCFVVLIVLFSAPLFAKAQVEKKVIDKSAIEKLLPLRIASINDEYLDKKEFLDYVITQFPNNTIPKNITEKHLQFLLATYLQNFINEKLLSNYMHSKNFTPTPKMVEKFYWDNYNNLAPDDKALVNARLQSQKININKLINNKKSDQNTVDKIGQYYFFKGEITDKIIIPDQAILDYYNANKIRFKTYEGRDISHIRVSFSPKNKKSKATAKKKVEKLAKLLKEDPTLFDKFAKNQSDAPNAKKYNGHIGIVYRNTTQKQINDAVFKLTEGQISDIITTQNCYHIVRLNKVYPPVPREFDEVKDAIKENLVHLEARKKMKELLDKLKNDNKVKVYITMPLIEKIGEEYSNETP